MHIINSLQKNLPLKARQERAGAGGPPRRCIRVASLYRLHGWRPSRAWPGPEPQSAPGCGSPAGRGPGQGVGGWSRRTGYPGGTGRRVRGGRGAAGRGPCGRVPHHPAPVCGVQVRRDGRRPRRGGVVRRDVVGRRSARGVTAEPGARACAQPGTGADAQQPALVPRSGHWARLTAGVRRQRRGGKNHQHTQKPGSHSAYPAGCPTDRSRLSTVLCGIIDARNPRSRSMP